MATKEQIARAVNDADWQKYRKSLKGLPTVDKLYLLKVYYFDPNHKLAPYSHRTGVGDDCDICIRIDNYLKALARGGQLHAGVSLEQALWHDWDLIIRK